MKLNILCENIRTYRKESGMTQKELAEKLGISDKTVSRWESGVQLPEASLLPELAEAFGTSIDQLYGIEKESDDSSESILKDNKKAIFNFKIWMIAGTLISLLGSLLYRYFGSAAFLTPSVYDAEYYNTAKGAAADIFAFVGIIMIFAGIFAVIVIKVRFATLYKPHMPDAVFAENVRYTGAAIVVYSVILLKTAPEILSFGFVVPREVYGCIFAAALTAVLMGYGSQLKKRGIASSKPVTIIALVTGGVGIAATVTGLILRDSLAVASAMSGEFSDYVSGSMAGVTAATILLSVSDWLILAMPVLLYINLLIKLRKE